MFFGEKYFFSILNIKNQNKKPGKNE